MLLKEVVKSNVKIDKDHSLIMQYSLRHVYEDIVIYRH
jgi:hypothetical protein